MFRRILIPLDGSERAEQAIPVAARLARAAGGEVVLARVVAISTAYGPFTGYMYMTDIIDTEMKDAQDYLAAQAQSPALIGVTVETNVIYGVAAQALLSMATQFEADLIVMTSEGKTGMKRWLLGSVAQKIARHSPVPVLVLREGNGLSIEARPDGSPMRALVTLDGSVLAKAALQPVAQLVAGLAAPAPGSLHLLRVAKSPAINQSGASIESSEHRQEQAMHKAKLYLQSIVEHLHDSSVGQLKLDTTWSVALSDDVAASIVQIAESGEGVNGRCDIIAMATHGREGFQHWELGSVTERVLSATHLPLLIVRPTSAEFLVPSEEQALVSNKF